jgi:hypothetical protein
MNVTLPANAPALLEVVEQAFCLRWEGRGEVLRWAITALALDEAGNRTATVQAVVLDFPPPSTMKRCETE